MVDLLHLIARDYGWTSDGPIIPREAGGEFWLTISPNQLPFLPASCYLTSFPLHLPCSYVDLYIYLISACLSCR